MVKQIRKQGGGTLLGIVIGLVIGLSIAVVVAITIKNTPLPFVDKLGKQDKPHGSGQIGDPNKPLYGNSNPAKEAAKEFARRAEEEKAAKGGQDAQDGKEAKSGTKDVAKAAPKDAAKPAPAAKGDAADTGAPVTERSTVEKSADKSQKADNADEKFTYYLQAGAFREQADAENTKAKLALMGVSASIAERQSDNGTLYRVRIGPFAQLEAMNRMRSKLSDNGVDVAVVKVPK